MWKGLGVILGALIIEIGAMGQTAIVVESPSADAQVAEFSSPVLRVRLEDSNGTFRWFARTPMDSTDSLVGTNIGGNGVFEQELTKLAPGNYNMPVVTRAVTDEWVTNYVRFTMTNRVRTFPRYTMSVLPGGTNTIPVRINNQGHVAGISDQKAFFFNGEMHVLGLGGAYGEATALNNKGQVVGVAYDAVGFKRAFLWDAKTGMQQLPVDGVPADINDNGDVIGNGPQGAFLWRAGAVRSLPGSVSRLNNRGFVAAGADGVYQIDGAASWDQFVRLRRPMEGIDPGTISATVINEANEVAGNQNSSIGGARYPTVYAFRYGAFERRLISAKSAYTYAQSINLLGDIVGSSSAVTYGPRGTVETEGPPRAYLATREGYRELNDLVPDRGSADIIQAVSINDRREILGVAKSGDNAVGVVLRPIPQFQTINFNEAAGTISAGIDGLIGARVKVETSSNLKDWAFHSAHELGDSTTVVETSLPNGVVFLRVTQAP